MRNLFFILASLVILISCTSVKIPKNQAEKRKKCRNVIRHWDEVMSSQVLENNNMLVISLHPEEVAEKFLKHPKDGVIVQLVGRQTYACDSLEREQTILRMHSMYRKDIEKHSFIFPFMENALSINYGTMPEEFKAYDYELNLMIIQRRYLCTNIAIQNTPSHDLQLLETGLFPIELTPDSLSRIAEKGLTTKFTLHYEQGQPKIDEDQLRSLVESIREIRNIRKFDVTGYASVEGSRDTNKKLFNARTSQVGDALKEAFPGVRVTESATENWEDFLHDIENTVYAHLANRQKFVIKKIIEEKRLQEALEPILQNHRKVVVAVNARFSIEEMDHAEIRKQYLSAYQEADLQRLLYIQSRVINKIRNHVLPEEFLKELNVPYREYMAPVYQNQLIHMFQLDLYDLMDTYYAMMELHKLLPNDPRILYNTTALMMRVMVLRPAEVNQKELEQMMYKVNKASLEGKLRQRLRVNYNMLMVRDAHGQGSVKKVNKLLSGIRSAYGAADYSEEDLLRLSNYFMHYGNEKYAEEVLYPIIRKGTINPETIFLFLPLTMSQPKFHNQSWFHDLLAQAYELDPTRYCRMFENSNKGGVSFQLLAIDELKARYCEWCEGGGATLSREALELTPEGDN